MSEQSQTAVEFVQNKKSLLKRVGAAVKSKAFLIGLPIGLAAGFCVAAPALALVIAAPILFSPYAGPILVGCAVPTAILTGFGLSSVKRNKQRPALIAGLLVGALGGALVGAPMEAAATREFSMKAPASTMQMASARTARLPIAVPAVV